MQILMAHRHRLLRDSMRPLLNRVAPHSDLIEAADFADAGRRIAQPEEIDLVLLGDDGETAECVVLIQAVKTLFSRAKLVILKDRAEARPVLQAIDAGADGVMFQTISAREMLTALRSVLAGATYLPGEIVRALAKTASQSRTPPRAAHFSPCELAVVPLLTSGLGNKLIARSLGIEEPAVKARLRGIYKKIGAANRAQAVMTLVADNGAEWPDYLPIVQSAF